jgi:hypothetical protein
VEVGVGVEVDEGGCGDSRVLVLQDSRSGDDVGLASLAFFSAQWLFLGSSSPFPSSVIITVFPSFPFEKKAASSRLVHYCLGATV